MDEMARAYDVVVIGAGPTGENLADRTRAAGLSTVIVGYATFCVVIVFNNVIARLRRLPSSPEEASGDLGADMWTTFRRITAPRLGTALLSAALLAFALSFDEIIVTNFTAGPGTRTIPLWI